MRLRPPRRRHGTILVLFALLTFILLALAALVIDLGFMRTTQQRMQMAADAAALEGMRGRDLYLTDPGTWSPTASDQNRRQVASQLVGNTFSDALNPGQPQQNNSGAGPVVQFTGGIPLQGTNYGAAQSYGPPGAYQPGTPPSPALQLNVADQPEGDMLAGTYTPGGLNNLHREGFDAANPFQRDDFSRVPQGAPANQANAFLVRLRRSNDPPEPGVSSTGPPLPYLFARGSLLGTNAKAAGIVVRATGIATTANAVSVGQPVTQDAAGNALPTPLPGGTPFALNFAAWQTTTLVPRGSSTTVSVQADGTLTLTGTNQTPVGYVIVSQPSLTLGQALPPDPNPAAPQAFVQAMLAQFPRGFGYVPIVDTVGPTAEKRVVGFGFVNLAAGQPGQFQMTIQTNRVAPDNASAVVVGSLAALPPAALTQVLNDQQQLSDGLQTPVLARSTGPSTTPLPSSP
jgi:hypothetical protein